MARALFPKWRYMDLERSADLSLISSDIEGFLDSNPRHVIIDEAQLIPALFPALRHALDNSRNKGRYILLGSASPSLVRSVSETLAGRTGFLELTPFRACELLPGGRAEEAWYWGGFPPIHALRGTDLRLEWLDGYVSAFLERDLPALGMRMPPRRLRVLWTMLTHIHGGLLNTSDLGRSLGVSHHTVADYLDLLEGAFMIRRLQPFHSNVKKRLVKAPKVYLRDTGLLHFLAGLRGPHELETWPRCGFSFEGMVIEELAAQATARIVRPEFYFWRTQTGAEVDLLIKYGHDLAAVEIKLGAAVDGRNLGGLRQCMSDLGLKRGWVVCTGRERVNAGGGVEIVPWSDVVNKRANFTAS